MSNQKDSNYYAQRNKQNLNTLQGLLDNYLPSFCYDYFLGIDSLTSPLTRLNYATDLKIFFYFLSQKKFHNKNPQEITLEELESVTSTDIEHYLSYLTNYVYDGREHSCNDKAKARKLSSVRAMFKYFFNKGLISVNNSAKVSTPKLHDKPIVRLEGDEVYDMIETAESGNGLTDHQLAYHEKNKERDTAIIVLFLGTGIRISELVGLNNESINFKDNSFKVTRKGGNEAILYFNDDVSDALMKYIEYKNNANLPSSPNSPLFLADERRITVRAVENLVKKYAKIVSPLKPITPHKLRSTYGTNLYRATGDIYVVADVLGHKDVNTTKKHYAAISDENRRSVVDKVKLHKSDDDKNI